MKAFTTPKEQKVNKYFKSKTTRRIVGWLKGVYEVLSLLVGAEHSQAAAWCLCILLQCSPCSPPSLFHMSIGDWRSLLWSKHPGGGWRPGTPVHLAEMTMQRFHCSVLIGKVSHDEPEWDFTSQPQVTSGGFSGLASRATDAQMCIWTIMTIKCRRKDKYCTS